jgi:hypothetical protein
VQSANLPLADRFDDVSEFTDRESFFHWLRYIAGPEKNNVKQSDTKRCERTNYIIVSSHHVMSMGFARKSHRLDDSERNVP